MEVNNSNIPIVLAFTPNYLVPASVTILSILIHSSANYRVICLLPSELSNEEEECLRDIDRRRLSFTFINLKDRLNGIYVDDRYTIVASYRLLLPDLLPEYQKVIYIDSDIVVRNDLELLYNSIDLEENYLAGVFEALFDSQIEYVEKIGVKNGSYINSGFLILNLVKLRDDGMVDKFIEASKNDKLQFPDQDVINQLCQGRIYPLPPIYNSIRTFYLPQYKNEFLKIYSLNDWNQVQVHGNIHYTGSKPWESFTIEFNQWWIIYDKLPNKLKDLNFGNFKQKVLYKLMSISIINSIVKLSISKYRYYKYKFR